MKLLVVTPVPLATPGGGQRLVAGIVDALVSHHGFDVVVAAGSGWSHPVPPVARPAREIRLPLQARSRRLHPQWSASALAGSRLAGLEDIVTREQPDAILYTPHWSGCAEQAALAAGARHTPFVMCPAIHLDCGQHTHRAARRLYRSAALLLALSDDERDWLIRVAGAAPDRVLTLRCGCRAACPAEARPEASERRGACLLTVGAFVRHKQIDHQIEAIAILRDRFGVAARLTVAGRCGDDSASARLTRLVHAYGLANAVELRPNCSDDDIEHLHAAADRFLFTSRSESFGLALLDAIAFGTWPVVYPHPIYRTLVESSGFGVVTDAASPKALAHAVFTSLTAAPACPERAGDRASRRGDHARRQWVASRSWTRAVEPLVAQLRQVR